MNMYQTGVTNVFDFKLTLTVDFESKGCKGILGLADACQSQKDGIGLCCFGQVECCMYTEESCGYCLRRSPLTGRTEVQF